LKLKVHFAVVGCGVISRFHLNAIQSIEDAALRGVYDTVSENAQHVAAEYDVQAYSDYAALLADKEVDAVCICTPSHLHAPLALEAIAAGKHVLIEKPIALTLEECDAISAAAKRMVVQVGVVSQLRYSPAIGRVRHALETGLLGRITRCDLYMKYYRPQSYYDSGTWRGTLSMDGGGALMNQGIHGIDLVQYLMGPADSIYALSSTLVRDIEVEDTLTDVVEWHCGAHGVIQASVGDYPGFPRRIEINGESGTIILEEDRIIKWEMEGNTACHIYEQPSAPEVRSHSEASAINPSGHIAQLRNFIDAVRGEGQLLVDDREGRKALIMILAAYRSAAQGVPVVL
jgi:predicted dehydrogenase